MIICTLEILIVRVVPDTDFEPGYQIPRYPSFENPDSDIRRLPDIRFFQ